MLSAVRYEIGPLSDPLCPWRVNFQSTTRQVDEGSLSLVLEGPGEPKATLYDVQCEGRRTILRVQPEKPGSSAKYYLFVRSGPNQGVPQLEAPMVQDWIDSWVSTKKGTFDFKKVTTSEWNAIDGGLEKIRQYTSRAQMTSFSRSTTPSIRCRRFFLRHCGGLLELSGVTCVPAPGRNQHRFAKLLLRIHQGSIDDQSPPR